MYKKKLEALKYPLHEAFDIDDETKVRVLIGWLENEYIRRYDMDSPERKGLVNPRDQNWDKLFEKYCVDTGGIPKQINSGERVELITWILSIALRHKYNDNKQKHPQLYMNKINGATSQAPSVRTANPLDHLDFSSPEFIEGIRDLANLLGITNHPNHLITLQAITTLVHDRMSVKVMKNLDDIKSKGAPWPIKEAEADMGFKSGDYVSNQASRILRLLYIHDLRDLQTKINECIVAIQKISANPKTDARLGKIGS